MCVMADAANEDSMIYEFRRTGSAATCEGVVDVYRVTAPTTIIGRQLDEVDFYLNSSVNKRLISRRHAQLERVYSGNNKKQLTFYLIDTSLNGTYVNDVKVSGPTVLKVKDTVTFGHTNGINVRDGMLAWQPNSEFRFVFDCVSAKAVSRAPPYTGTESNIKSVNSALEKKSNSSRQSLNFQKSVQNVLNKNAELQNVTQNTAIQPVISTSINIKLENTSSQLTTAFTKTAQPVDRKPQINSVRDNGEVHHHLVNNNSKPLPIKPQSRGGRKDRKRDVYEFDSDEEQKSKRRIADGFTHTGTTTDTSTPSISQTISTPMQTAVTQAPTNLLTVSSNQSLINTSEKLNDVVASVKPIIQFQNSKLDTGTSLRTNTTRVAQVAPISKQLDPPLKVEPENKPQKPIQKVSPVTADQKPVKHKNIEVPHSEWLSDNVPSERKTLTSLSSDFGYFSHLITEDEDISATKPKQEKRKKDSKKTQKVDRDKLDKDKHHKEEVIARAHHDSLPKEDTMDKIRQAFASAGIKPKRDTGALSVDTKLSAEKPARPSPVKQQVESKSSEEDDDDDSSDEDDSEDGSSSSSSTSSSSDDDEESNEESQESTLSPPKKGDKGRSTFTKPSPKVLSKPSKSPAPKLTKKVGSSLSRSSASIKKDKSRVTKVRDSRSKVTKPAHTRNSSLLNKRRRPSSDSSEVFGSSDEEVLPSKLRKKSPPKQPSVTFKRPTNNSSKVSGKKTKRRTVSPPRPPKAQKKATRKTAASSNPEPSTDIVMYPVETCDSPDCLKPQDSTIDWVQCDDCDGWFHTICVGCSIDVVQDKTASFHCGCS